MEIKKNQIKNYESISVRTIPFSVLKDSCYEISIILRIPDRGWKGALSFHVGYLPFETKKEDAFKIGKQLAKRCKEVFHDN